MAHFKHPEVNEGTIHKGRETYQISGGVVNCPPQIGIEAGWELLPDRPQEVNTEAVRQALADGKPMSSAELRKAANEAEKREREDAAAAKAAAKAAAETASKAPETVKGKPADPAKEPNDQIPG